MFRGARVVVALPSSVAASLPKGSIGSYHGQDTLLHECEFGSKTKSFGLPGGWLGTRGGMSAAPVAPLSMYSVAASKPKGPCRSRPNHVRYQLGAFDVILPRHRADIC
jgi:hypothetical protein